MDAKRFTLAELKDGVPALVETVAGGQALLKRLSAMGITPGGRLVKESGHGQGPVVVLVRGARLALGRGMASKIILKAAVK